MASQEDGLDGMLDRREVLKRGGLIVGAGLGGALLGTPDALARYFAVAEPQRGGTLVVGLGQVLEDINPLSGDFYRWLQVVMFTMYEPLVKYGEGGKIIPQLATSWKASKDNKSFEFKLRPGVKFHSGREMTADDVVFCLNRWNGKQPLPGAISPDVWGGARKVSKDTIVIRTKVPSRLLELLRWNVVWEKQATAAQMQRQSAGTGPFKIDKFVKGDRVELVRNPGYWNAGKPLLDGLTFKFLTDAAVQISNFLSGGVDMLHDIPVSNLKQVDGKRNSRSLRSGLFFHWWCPQILNGPLAKADARIALRHAFDRKTMNKVAWAGKGIDTWNPLDLTPLGIKVKPDAAYNIDKARKLLRDAGIAGEQVNLSVLVGSQQGSLEAQVLVQGFRDAGLKSDIVPKDPNAWREELYSKRTGQGLYNNFGTLPFPWSNILRYMMNPMILPYPPKYPKAPEPSLYRAYARSQSSASNADYSRWIKTAQRRMLALADPFHSFVAYNYQIIPKTMRGLEATSIGDVRFESVAIQ